MGTPKYAPQIHWRKAIFLGWTVEPHQKQLISNQQLAITSARKLAATNIQKAQKKYKAMHDK